MGSIVPAPASARGATAVGWLVAALLLSWSAVGLTAGSLPSLTGRIVDAAQIIDTASKAEIARKLQDLESKSGIQLVVATVKSLDGQDIESYSNQLFRAWKVGEKTKNNGALLLVAPSERKVRIEVGYGLEGTLTDALSNVIITNAMVPRFKSGDFTGGISRGVNDIIAVLTTDPSDWQQRTSFRADSPQKTDPVNWLIFTGIIIVGFLLIWTPAFRWVFLNVVLNLAFSAGGSRSSGGSSSGGGFSGGGGSSGGGGASGSW
jgi:uncharacterized protein